MLISKFIHPEKYIKDETAWFYTHKDPRYILTNMASLPLTYKRITWKSSEALYQATKYSKTARCTSDINQIANVRQRIFEAHNAMASKITQKCAVDAGLVRPDWHKQSVPNMLYIVGLKFACNYEKIFPVLEKTGHLPIVEISSKDSFWGCKMVHYTSGTRLVGNNVLGKIWMYIRTIKEMFINGNVFDEPENFFID